MQGCKQKNQNTIAQDKTRKTDPSTEKESKSTNKTPVSTCMVVVA
jgi:hypothetical protein